MDVLVTGAAGRIGTAFCAASEGGPLRLRRADLHDRSPASPFPFVPLDVTDAAACRAACAGVEAVLHLAADPSPDADFRGSVLPVNIAGTYNMVEAGAAAGVRRFVFASSAQAVEGYPTDRQVRETDPPRPANDYGVGKAFGEALCASFAQRSDTSFVALRIAFYAEQVPPATGSFRNRTAWLSPRDAAQLLTAALTATVTGFVVAHGVSDNAAKRLSLERTRRDLGYQPVDDAFAPT